MKKIMLYGICLIFIGYFNSGCRENGTPKVMDPFAPVLKQKIREFIKYTDIEQPDHGSELFYTVNARKNNDTSFITMRTEYYYNPEWYNIGGYTFLDSNLIVFENAPGPLLLEAFQPFEYEFYTPINLIDTTKLIKFQDSIPGYQDGRKGIGNYEPLMYKFRLIGKDSLVLIFSGPW